MSPKRTNPKLWQSSKKRACTVSGLCKHSARKMQWAVQDYKRHGGGYEGPKRASNRLVQWTKQQWRTYNGKLSKGTRRYLPDAVWSKLSPDQIRRTNAFKRRGFLSGKQWVKQPPDVATIASRTRRTMTRRTSQV